MRTLPLRFRWRSENRILINIKTHYYLQQLDLPKSNIRFRHFKIFISAADALTVFAPRNRCTVSPTSLVW
jgi:hypothetical protein